MKTKKQIKQEIKKTNGLIQAIYNDERSYIKNKLVLTDTHEDKLTELRQKLFTLMWVLDEG